MGKYMRKAKITGEVAVMEVHQSSLGVRTRARTLALKQLQKSLPDSSSYLQLRSRRLEKPLAAAAVAKPKESCKESPKPSPNPKPRTIKSQASHRAAAVNSSSLESVPIGSCSEKEEAAPETSPEIDGGVEVSFGENVLELEARDRSIRETTPCSLIRNSETIATPGSTTRPTNSTATNGRTQSLVHRNIPTTLEMEEFFAGVERHQQRNFREKYNFDPVSDCPLPGRYEWVKLD